jgi:hypothetical protein
MLLLLSHSTTAAECYLWRPANTAKVSFNPDIRHILVSWPSPSTGWELQQNTNSVGSVKWSSVIAKFQDDGTNKTLIVSPPAGNRFHRLRKP